MKTLTLLNQKNLSNLHPSIVRPTYDRENLTAGIIHIGVGGFHRSHEAFYTDDLLEKTGASDWGICGVGLRENDRKIADILKRQDYLYTLIVKHPDGKIENRVIGSIIDFILACDNPSAVIDRIASETTKVVSLTITEGGYNLNSTTNEFDLENPDVQHDLANPQQPRLVFGYLTESLRKRRLAGLPAFTIQSCDNIQHNGDITRKMLLAFATAQDPELAEWISKEVKFPNAMVDRITPVTTPSDIKMLENDCELRDEWPVTCEPFHQWVIEDNFSNGRPAWEQVGAQFVPDVTPYEKMKIRLLNAGHSLLGMLGSVQGYNTIDECISDPLFETYYQRFMDVEVSPVLSPVPGINLNEYKSSLIERFGNPNIKDDLARIRLESSSKLPKFLISTIEDNLKTGGSTELAALVLAAWCYCSDKGISKDGQKLEIVDEMKSQLHAAASGTAKNKLSFLQLRSVFGDLADHKSFADEYTSLISDLYENTNIARLMQTLLFGRE